MFPSGRQPYQFVRPRPYPSPKTLFPQSYGNAPQSQFSPRVGRNNGRRGAEFLFPPTSPFGGPRLPQAPAKVSPLRPCDGPRNHPPAPVPDDPFLPKDPPPKSQWHVPRNADRNPPRHADSPRGARYDPPSTGPSRVRDEAKRARRLHRHRAAREPSRPPPPAKDEDYENLKRISRCAVWGDLLSDFEGPMSNEDRALIRELERLTVDKFTRESLAKAEATVEGAAALGRKRARETAKRDAEFKERMEREAREEEYRLLEEQRLLEKAKWEEERIKEEARLAEEAAVQARLLAGIQRLHQLRMEENIRLREQAHREKAQREEEARRAQEHRKWEEEQKERQRQENERREREEAERREQQEIRRMREEAQERAAQANAFEDAFKYYDDQWDDLRKNPSQDAVRFAKFPWPSLYPVNSPADITYSRVKEFVHHPLRPSLQAKTKREQVKADLLLWHPDKLNPLMHKTSKAEEKHVREAAGVVVRLLLQLLHDCAD